MDFGPALLVLSAAALHAGWNAVIKIRSDRLVAMAVVTLFGSVASAAVLPFIPPPAPEAWPLLALTIVLHTAYHLFLPLAYDRGDLGQVYPIARGSAPLLVTLGAFVFAGETVHGIALSGILCLTAGVMALTFDPNYGGAKSPGAVLMALATGAIIASYTVVDGLGARQAGSALGFAAWLTFGDGLLTLAIVLLLRGRSVLAVAKTYTGSALLGGTMQVSAYWIVVWALTLAPMGLVSALRETSVLFAALISTFLLREGLSAWRFVSTALVTLGLLLTSRDNR